MCFVKREKVIVALSGGVDSSVAAALAVRAGCEVIGATLRMKHPDPAFSAVQFCASKNDEAVVDEVVRKLGIEHHYLECFPQFFKQVLLPGALEYGAGRTPNPCCICNQVMKFGVLEELAETLGATRIFTGHYAKIRRSADGTVRLFRGDDPHKDQSYFLYRLTPRELRKVDFPVGSMAKTDVRAVAAELGLPTSRKPDSQDACFQVPGECFGETLRRVCELPPKPGAFLYHGKIVGRHRGVHCYTIGQRKGLGVALGVPAYVAAIDPESGNILLETDENALLRREFDVAQINWVSGSAPAAGDRHVSLQIRYRSAPSGAELEPLSDGRMRVHCDQLQRAVTPGQAAVFYNGDELLGGGVICDVV